MVMNTYTELPLTAVKGIVQYLKKNPTDPLYVARQAASLRSAIPLDLLKWLVKQLVGKNEIVRHLTLTPTPPGVTVSATLEVMGAPVEAQATVEVDEVHFTPDAFRLTLHLSHVTAKSRGGAENPVNLLLNSPSIDLSKPANLLQFLPKKPRFVVAAKDDRIELDLLKIFGKGKKNHWRRFLTGVAPLFAPGDVYITDNHLLISWRLPKLRA